MIFTPVLEVLTLRGEQHQRVLLSEEPDTFPDLTFLVEELFAYLAVGEFVTVTCPPHLDFYLTVSLSEEGVLKVDASGVELLSPTELRSFLLSELTSLGS